MAAARYRALRGAACIDGGVRSKQTNTRTEGTNVMSKSNERTISRIDDLLQAKETNLGAAALLLHLVNSTLTVEPTELDAIHGMMIAATETMDEVIEALKADRAAGNQNADYWRGYEDGKAAAAASAQQKAIAAQGA